jgi:glycosyltransferase 2 family protein
MRAVALASPDQQEMEPPAEQTASITAPVGRLERVSGAVRVVFGIVIAGVMAAAVVAAWHDVRPALERISVSAILVAEVLVLAGLALSAVTWRVALAELGPNVGLAAATRIYVLGQLGKYVPGSFWALAAQMELAARVGAPRAQALAASTIAIGVNVATGLAVGLAVVPSVVSGGAWRIVLVVAAPVACAAALSPPVLTRLVDRGLRILRQQPLSRPVSWRGIAVAAAWSFGSWAAYGAAIWVLAASAGASSARVLPLAFAAIALAMTLGFLVIVAPSGLGVREAVIVAALAPELARPAALAVALVARLVFTLADVVGAVAVFAVARPSPGRSLR